MKFNYKYCLSLVALPLTAALFLSTANANATTTSRGTTSAQLICNVAGGYTSGINYLDLTYILNGQYIFSSGIMTLSSVLPGVSTDSACKVSASLMCQAIRVNVALGYYPPSVGTVTFPFNINVTAYTASTGTANSQFTYSCL
jgi:hypothetical protein